MSSIPFSKTHAANELRLDSVGKRLQLATAIGAHTIRGDATDIAAQLKEPHGKASNMAKGTHSGVKIMVDCQA